MSIYNALNIPSQSNGLIIGTGSGFEASTLGGANGMDVAFATGSITLSNLRDCSRYVVSTIAGETEYTSIQAAINQAESDGASQANPATVIIWEGEYTENLNLSPWVNLVCFSKNITINGYVDYSSGGIVNIVNLYFELPDLTGREILTVTNNSALNLYQTEFNSLDASSISFSIQNSYLNLNNKSFINSSILNGNIIESIGSLIECKNSNLGSASNQQILLDNTRLSCKYSEIFSNIVLLNFCSVQGDFSFFVSENEMFNINDRSNVILYNSFINCLADNDFVIGTGTFIFSGLEFSFESTGRRINPTINKVGQYRISSVLGNTGSSVPVTTETGQLTLVGSGGIIVNGDAANNTLTISGGSGGVSWQSVNISQNLTVNTGYFCVAPGTALSLALPVTSSVGDTIIINLDGATSYTITQGASQQIRFGLQETTSGALGSLTTTSQGCTLNLVCSVANLRWNAISSEGTFTIV